MLLVVGFCASAFAYGDEIGAESEANVGIEATGEAVSDESNTVNTSESDESVKSENTATDGLKSNQPSGEGDVNIFSALFEAIKNSLTEILCLVTVVCSVLMTYAFKKGIFPAVRGGISVMKKALGNIEKASESSNLYSKELGEKIAEKLGDTEKRLDVLFENITKLETLLIPTDKELRRSTAQSQLIYGQLELLSDVFMAVAIPQSVKDEILVRISEMKRAVKENEEG